MHTQLDGADSQETQLSVAQQHISELHAENTFLVAAAAGERIESEDNHTAYLHTPYVFLGCQDCPGESGV